MAPSKKNSTAIVVSAELSHWGSCRIITPNLQKAYQQHYGKQAQFFSWTPQHTPAETFTVARLILQSSPQRLVFLDHMPHPQKLLEAICMIQKPEQLPPVDFHIYGDFTLYATQWQAIEKTLKRMRVHFYCASHRQEALVSSFFQQGTAITSRCPFPVDPKQYYYSSEHRQKTRRALGFSDQEKVILYTGRLSLQKNILRLTREIAKHIENSAVPTRFLLCGHFDQLGAPFFGVHLAQSEYFDQWQTLLESLPEKVRQRISYLGNKTADELRALYNASDLYVSLSTHHDEDFGMSPLESLCSGAPCALSGWGGYASFALDSDSCLLAPVEITEKGLRLSSAIFQKNLQTLLAQKETDLERDKRARFYSKQFSIQTAQQLIALQQQKSLPKFKGFKKTLSLFSKRLLKHFSGAALFETGPIKNSFYHQVYKNYVIPSSQELQELLPEHGSPKDF